MGNTAIDLPQGGRPSSMFLAMRWKQENRQWIHIAALISIAVTCLFLFMLYGTSYKEITLVINGEEQTITTRQWKVDRLLAEQAILIDPHDRISLPAGSKLKHGHKVIIDHTVPVALTVNGEQHIVHTTGKTVADTLGDLNIQLGEFDKTVPALEAPIEAGNAVRVIRVQKEFTEVEKDIPFSVITKNDSKLVKGKETVVTEGKEGSLIETVENTYEDGILTSTKVIDTTISAASVDKVVAIGTKKPVTVLSASSPVIQEVTKKGITFGVKQILSGVVLTAYDAGVQSTGKSSEHPQYGITYSGTKVQEGRTIAVDPKVIPMGWWVYIEGYGFRRAEDKGSGVKGKHIDIYFDDGDYANKFGKKRGITVYIVGPKKPETN